MARQSDHRTKLIQGENVSALRIQHWDEEGYQSSGWHGIRIIHRQESLPRLAASEEVGRRILLKTPLSFEEV